MYEPALFQLRFEDSRQHAVHEIIHGAKKVTVMVIICMRRKRGTAM